MLPASVRRSFPTLNPHYPPLKPHNPNFPLLISHLPVSLRLNTLLSLSFLIKTSPPSLLRSLHSLLSAFSLQYPLHFSCRAALSLSCASPPLRPLAQSLIASLLSTSSSTLPLQWADQYCSVNMRYSALDLVLCAFLKSGMITEALNALHRIRSIEKTPSLSSLSILLRMLFQRGHMNHAWKVFVEMLAKGPFPTHNTFNTMILGFCRRGLIRVADGLLRIMRKFRINPDACSFNILIKAHCVYGRSVHAFELFDEMLDWGCIPTVVTCSILIDALCKEGRMVEAREFFDAMLNEQGVEYNTITYNVLLDGYVKAGHINTANLVYQEMIEKNLVPDSCTINILLSGRYKFRKVIEGKDNILNNLKNSEVLNNHNNNDGLIDVLVSKFCWEGELDKARDILQKTIRDKKTISVVVFNSVITGFSKKGLEQEAFKLYQQMLDLGLSPSTSTCNALILVLCNNDKLDNARDLLDEMLNRGFCVNTAGFTIYLNACFKARDLNSALNCWHDMVKFGLNPDLIAFSAYINGLCRANYLQEAKLAFNEMIKRGIVPNNFTYNSLIHGFCRVGDLTQALKLEEKMRQNGLIPDIFTINILVDGLCRLGRVKLANNLLAQMENYGFAPDVVTYNTFINTFCSGLDTTNAVNYFNKMLSKGCVPDLYTYNIWIHCLCTSHMINPAVKMLDELESIGLTPNAVTFNTLMNSVCHDVLDRAKMVAAKLLKIGFKPNVVTVNLLLSHFCKQGTYKKVLFWADKLREKSFIFDDATRRIIERAQKGALYGKNLSIGDYGRCLFIDFLMVMTYESICRDKESDIE